ncbi:ABC transporter substrate-binding protein [Gordonia insulae]|uniref:ABC transporter substrate-binding lipoprotein YhfQ n=1 Tax=Gordonia insulae TaxID=2420509 RepID=A0A3G8JUK0_9ACTN|nr:ABC transporter substrate-binding protein [Gordonia insulae]AZG47840.1 Putative ABC transporter substrate-binding lipoprotein YhfQ [Gordonia insulae]
MHTSPVRLPRPIRLGAVAVTAAAALAVGGCTPPDENSATSASAPAPEAGALPVTIDHRYGTTTVESAPKRVAAMGVGDADTLLALGITPTTIAPFADPTQRSAPWNADLLGDAEPVILPQTAAQFGDQIAKALATDPDLVTAVGAAATQQQYDVLSKAAPTIVGPKEYPNWQIPWDVQTTEIGRSVGLPRAAEAKIGETNDFLAGVRAKHPEFAGKTGVVISALPTGAVSVFSAQDGRGQALADYGLTFPESLKPAITNGFYGEISAENLNMLNDVDVVVAVDWEGANERLKKDPTWTKLPVVTEGRTVYLDQQVGSAMSVPTVLTIPWVADQAVGPIAQAASKS